MGSFANGKNESRRAEPGDSRKGGPEWLGVGFLKRNYPPPGLRRQYSFRKETRNLSPPGHQATQAIGLFRGVRGGAQLSSVRRSRRRPVSPRRWFIPSKEKGYECLAKPPAKAGGAKKSNTINPSALPTRVGPDAGCILSILPIHVPSSHLSPFRRPPRPASNQSQR
jgi:hypothetical protein